jgi:hypothetical protein
MASQAVSAYGVEMRVSDGVALAPLAVVAASNTTPIVITTVPHGIVDVAYGTVAGALGNTGANGAWILERVSATELELRGSVGTGAYGGGGALVIPGTFAPIAELRNVIDAGSSADVIDTSSHDGSGYSSEVTGLKRVNHMRLEINLALSDPTHDEVTGLVALHQSGVERDWMLVLPPATVGAAKSAAHVHGAVAEFTTGMAVNAALQAQVTLIFDSPFTWLA